jgi:hypothetical protein
MIKFLEVIKWNQLFFLFLEIFESENEIFNTQEINGFDIMQQQH